MAMNTGAVQPSDFPYTVKAEADGTPYSWDRVYIILPLLAMPQHWCSTFLARHQRMYLDWFANVKSGGAGGILRAVWRFYSDDGLDHYESETTNTTTPQWGNGALPKTTSNYLRGENLKDMNLTGGYQPRFVAIEVSLQMTAASADGEVHGLYFECANDEAYTDPPPTGTNYMDQAITRGSAAGRIYKEHMPVSSYQTMQALAHSLNNMMYQRGYSITVPLWGN